ncbi:MAG: nitroreductase/quinone reductase family protein [Ilumatobacter sp.]|uniref:nitroreductase/quinone reductase family protein n=1 Tax=Ilumatobacter sp. TaxID=1967498 RepID=UPI0026146F7E|nr:nitroreductase/quinone reductase family protein [Ilumatobacter sp.]MDJ0767942.1 nitroreductase/quinone reductase family protein [Ilumatobacter sp.]
MFKAILRLVGVLVGAALAVAVVFVVGMRTKFPPVLNAVRRMNREVWNPRQMETAGKPGAWASIIRHVGRNSGREYETPVVAVHTDDGFVIALPYGHHADWLKNVMAQGSATLVHEGEAHHLDHAVIVPIEDVNHHFPEKEQQTHLMFGIDQALVLREADPAGSTSDASHPRLATVDA